MKNSIVLKSSLLGIGVGFAALSAASAVSFDANVTPDVIFGSGNANGGFTVDQNNGIELGLRAKVRLPTPLNVFNSNGDGTYSFPTGGSGSRPLWNFEWSINSDYQATSAASPLTTYTYLLGIDSDSTMGTSFLSFDPINGLPADHSLGDNTTANGGGYEAVVSGVEVFPGAYASAIGLNNVAQNSWTPHWFVPFNPNSDGTYDFFMAAYDGQGQQVARTDMQVIVGQGGAAVPDGGSMFVLFGGALLGLAGYRRFSLRG